MKAGKKIGSDILIEFNQFVFRIMKWKCPKIIDFPNIAHLAWGCWIRKRVSHCWTTWESWTKYILSVYTRWNFFLPQLRSIWMGIHVGVMHGYPHKIDVSLVVVAVVIKLQCVVKANHIHICVMCMHFVRFMWNVLLFISRHRRFKFYLHILLLCCA